MGWTAFILGLAGSLHCVGMCGPLAMALPHHGRGMGGYIVGRMLYQLGRITTYMILGAVFGAIGRSLALAGIQRWVSIAAGILVLAGVFVAGPAWAGGPIAGWVGWIKARLGILLRRRSQSTLWMLGLVNGLLPCGLVYVACLGAAAGGSVPGGILQMAWFGLGTVPLMLAISLSGRAIPFGWRLRLQRLIPVSVGLVGALLVLRGMDLGIPFVSPHIGPDGCCH
jgi:hypothetical protein